MRRTHSQRAVATFIIALWAAMPAMAFAQDVEGRPHIDRDVSDRPGKERADGRVEVRSEKERVLEEQKSEIDDKLKALDDRITDEGRKSEEDRPAADRLTKADEVAKSVDLTKPGKAEAPDPDALLKEIGRDTDAERKPFKEAGELSQEVIETRNEKGNFGLGSATEEVANRAGRDFVGEDAEISSDGKALVSKDGSRQYRFPEYKSRIDKTQANFERRDKDSGRVWSNGHVDIVRE